MIAFGHEVQPRTSKGDGDAEVQKKTPRLKAGRLGFEIRRFSRSGFLATAIQDGPEANREQGECGRFWHNGQDQLVSK